MSEFSYILYYNFYVSYLQLLHCMFTLNKNRLWLFLILSHLAEDKKSSSRSKNIADIANAIEETAVLEFMSRLHTTF